MRSFRVVDCRDDPLRGWNFNTINLGLAHGIVGPIAALTAYLRNNEADGLAAEAVQLATAWLMAETREDFARYTNVATRAYRKEDDHAD